MLNRTCALCLAVETAWHSAGNGGSKGAGQPDGSSGATAGTTSTPDTAMVLHGSGSGGPATPGTGGSGPIPELPFASALLTSSDYKVDVGELGARVETVDVAGFPLDSSAPFLRQPSGGRFVQPCKHEGPYAQSKLPPSHVPGHNPFTLVPLRPCCASCFADPSSGKPVLLGSGHFANVYRGVYGAEPAAIKVGLRRSRLAPVLPLSCLRCVRSHRGLPNPPHYYEHGDACLLPCRSSRSPASLTASHLLAELPQGVGSMKAKLVHLCGPTLQVIKEPGLLDRQSLLQEVAILKSCRHAGWIDTNPP